MKLPKTMIGITLTPELLAKFLALVFSLGVLYEKVDSVERRVTRIERFIDSRTDNMAAVRKN